MSYAKPILPHPHGDRPNGSARHDFHLGLFCPSDGIAGIWGPSTHACAMLAIEEINGDGGIGGRHLQAHCFSADDEANVALNTSRAILDDNVEAIVGMHTSSVRNIIKQVVRKQLPYVYTPLYEGGENSAGVFAIGETPKKQLKPALGFLVERYRARRWVLVGNDYVWPRQSHALARNYLASCGATVLAEHYVSISRDASRPDFDAIFERIEQARPDALLISLVGQDAVEFNRQFASLKLGRQMIRLSCAIEENCLLAIGADNTDGLFVSAGYFSALDSVANMQFKDRYHQRFGERAPTLNTIGQSLYEGIHFLAALMADGLQAVPSPSRAVPFRSIRGTHYHSNNRIHAPIYLAEAQGHLFRILNSFS